MPAFEWPRAPFPIVQAFSSRVADRGHADGLLAWAVRSVEALYYLADLDDFPGQAFASVHLQEVIDGAHVRWALGTSISALDLCAAVLGRTCCGHTGNREFDLRSFDLRTAGTAGRRSLLPAAPLAWVDLVLVDPSYEKIQKTRNLIVHSRPMRHFTLTRRRPDFEVDDTGGRLSVCDLICLARDVATHHVVAFLDIVDAL